MKLSKGKAQLGRSGLIVELVRASIHFLMGNRLQERGERGGGNI